MTQMNPIIEQRVLGFDVYKERPSDDNGKPRDLEYLGFVPSYSKRAMKAAALQIIGPRTHMHEIHKVKDGYRFSTTIGIYLHFKLVHRMVTMVSGAHWHYEWKKEGVNLK